MKATAGKGEYEAWEETTFSEENTNHCVMNSEDWPQKLNSYYTEWNKMQKNRT
jgi:hypothetical protein